MLGSEGLGLGSVGTAAQIGANSKTPTLAQVYAAGAGSPATDDLMAMQLGTTLRFQGSANASLLPYIGTYETNAGQALAATGLPAMGWSLATVAGTFGRSFNGYQMFLPGWDFNFFGIADKFFTIESLLFNNTAETSWGGGLSLGGRDYSPGGRRPEGFPTGSSGAGAMVHELNLYQTQGNNVATVDQIDGFGQHRGVMFPVDRGITWQRSTHWQSGFIGGTQPGDGTGWGIFESPLNHDGGDSPRGAIACRALDTLGNWEWSLFVNDGAGGFADVADFSLSGITLATPVTFGWAPTAPGATAVTINNSPGVSAAPVEYLAIKNNAGQTRYIALLA